MKKELFAGALLAVILSLALLNTRHIGALCGELADFVLEAERAAYEERWEDSERAVSDALSLWHSRELYAGVVLRHTDIETLTDDFYELSEHIYTHDPGAVKSAGALVREHLNGIADMESFRLGSVF